MRGSIRSFVFIFRVRVENPYYYFEMNRQIKKAATYISSVYCIYGLHSNRGEERGREKQRKLLCENKTQDLYKHIKLGIKGKKRTAK